MSYAQDAYNYLQANADEWCTADRIARDLGWPRGTVTGRLAPLYRDQGAWPHLDKIDGHGKYRYVTQLVPAIVPTLFSPEPPKTTAMVELLKQLGAEMAEREQAAEGIEHVITTLRNVQRMLRGGR